MLNRWFEQLLRQRFALPVLLMGAGALLLISETQFDRARDSFNEVRLHREAYNKMLQVMQLLTDAETGQRGYVLTGRSEFLQPYNEGVTRARVALAEVNGYLQAEGLDAKSRELSALVDAKLSELETTVLVRRGGNEEGARTLIQSGIGREQMQAVRERILDVERHALASVERSRNTLMRALTLNRFGTAALVALAALGIVLYLQQLGELDREREAQKRRLEQDRERLEAEVRRRTAELRELAGHLQRTREDERAALARELHDELGALLTAAKLDVARLRSKLGDQPEQLTRLAHLTQALNDGIALKRRIIEDLRPSSLSNLGLVTALEILCREMSDRLGIAIAAELAPVTLPPATDLTVYRFVQEALTNIGKYAGAADVRVSLSITGDHVLVEVADDGVGFDPRISQVGHHGLAGMRFRVESLGGRMHIDSAPACGTRLRAELPVAPQPLAMAAA